MRKYPLAAAAVLTSSLALSIGFAAGSVLAPFGVKSFEPAGFVIDHAVLVDGTPEEVFDAFTGDVSPWWDHTFSGKPKSLELQPRLGGAFVEVFDDEGNGAIHALVTGVERGKEIRFTGQLGFAGDNINLQMTHRVRFSREGDETRVIVDVHGVGEVGEEIPQIVHSVWRHFLSERFEPYVEGRLDD